jgi:hypothetical protein
LRQKVESLEQEIQRLQKENKDLESQAAKLKADDVQTQPLRTQDTIIPTHAQQHVITDSIVVSNFYFLFFFVQFL